MKNLITATFIALLFVSISVSAKIPPKNRAAELRYIQNLVDEQIVFPSESECCRIGFVKARILISSDQKIVIQEINGYPELTNYVKKRLENTAVAYPRFIGRQYICKIDFRN